jgi:hypothetical protein
MKAQTGTTVRAEAANPSLLKRSRLQEAAETPTENKLISRQKSPT